MKKLFISASICLSGEPADFVAEAFLAGAGESFIFPKGEESFDGLRMVMTICCRPWIAEAAVLSPQSVKVMCPGKAGHEILLERGSPAAGIDRLCASKSSAREALQYRCAQRAYTLKLP